MREVATRIRVPKEDVSNHVYVKLRANFEEVKEKIQILLRFLPKTFDTESWRINFCYFERFMRLFYGQGLDESVRIFCSLIAVYETCQISIYFNFV